MWLRMFLLLGFYLLAAGCSVLLSADQLKAGEEANIRIEEAADTADVTSQKQGEDRGQRSEVQPFGEEFWNAWEEVELDMEEQEKLQEQVDGGHRVGLLNPYDVGAAFIHERYKDYGGVERVDDVSEGREQILRYTFETNCQLEMKLSKPVLSVWAVSEVRMTTACTQQAEE